MCCSTRYIRGERLYCEFIGGLEAKFMKKEYREKRRNPMDEIRNAIIEDPFSIKKIKNPSNEIIKFAIENDVNVIQYIKNPSDEIVQYAKNLILKK